MRVSGYRWRIAAALAAGVSTILAIVVWLGAGSDAASAAKPHVAEAPAVKVYAPAANLRIVVASVATKADSLLDPQSEAWSQPKATSILLNRTPRIYATEPIQERPAPRCLVKAIRAGGKLFLHLQWDDATTNAPAAPPARKGEGGDPKQLYKRPTGETSTFPDAAAVMVPEKWHGPAFPSLLMGDHESPARLYYWNASHGAEVLNASGRATPQPTGMSVPFRALHADGKWTLIMELPDQPDGYPIAFATWDGELGDRDGLKFFSIWYVLTREVK